MLYTSNLSALLAVWVGRRQRSVLWYYALSSLFFDVLSYVLKRTSVKWRSANLFLLIEFILVSVYFISKIERKNYRNVAYTAAGVMCMYYISHTLSGTLYKVNFTDASLLYGMYILYSLVGLYKVITEIEFVMVERNPLFIVSVAFLLYASGNFIIFLFENNVLLMNKGLKAGLWLYIHNPLNILKNFMLAYAFLLINKGK